MQRRVRVAWAVLHGAIREARDDGVSTAARALAYSLFLAIPASLLLALGVFSLAADPGSIDQLLDRASRVMPQEAVTLLRESLTRSTESSSEGIVMTVVGLVLAVWTTTSAATTLMEALTRIDERPDERSFVRRRLLALAIVAALVLAAVLVVTLLVLGPHLESWLGSALEAERLTAWVWWSAQWPILIGALLFLVATVLHVGPDVEPRGWRHVVPGAVVSVAVWLVASGGFAVYTSQFGSYEKTWGTISAVAVTLVWLWLTSAALLLGGEVNAEARRLAARRQSSSASSRR